MRLIYVFPIALAVPVRSVSAQITWDGCVDRLGNPVASIRNDNLRDVAMATIVNGQPAIIYNARVLSWQQPQTRLFWYGHECGHHALGHTLGAYVIGREQQADCYGITTLVQNGVLGSDDVPVVQRDLAAAGRGDWEHLPGPIRAVNLRACLDAADIGKDRDDEGDDPEGAADPFEDIDSSGDVSISDEDVTWDKNPATARVSFRFELENAGDTRARCTVRVNLILVDRLTDDPTRVHDSRSYPISVPAGESRVVRGSMRWYGDDEVYPAIRSQLKC